MKLDSLHGFAWIRTSGRHIGRPLRNRSELFEKTYNFSIPCRGRPMCPVCFRVQHTSMVSASDDGGIKTKTASENPKLLFVMGKSDCAFHLVGTKASCTDMYMARSTINNSFDALDVGLPSSVGTSMGVRDLDTESHALAADIALCHLLHLLAVKILTRVPKNAYIS